jgi:hypothetical protein
MSAPASKARGGARRSAGGENYNPYYIEKHGGMISMLGFNKQQVRDFLAWNSYTSNLDELSDFPRYYPVEVSETEAYLDISPNAVRKGNVKPERRSASPSARSYKVVNLAGN